MTSIATRSVFTLGLGAIAVFLISCSGAETPTETTAETDESATATAEEETAQEGTLEFRANGEDFVRQGFVSKDGWQIDFEHLYVNLADVKAYQADGSYDPDSGKAIEASQVVEVPGEVTVDLAEGDADAEPVLIETVDAPAGEYNALSWEMTPASSGPAEGSTLLMEGTASKDGETIPFTIQLDPEYSYTCGEFVGDTRKGILTGGEDAEVEATFHFDHVFGDGEAPADDPINTGALGFGPLAELATDGTLMTNMEELEQSLSPEDYSTLEEALVGLGHVGEGHCSEVSASHTHGDQAS